MLPDTSRRTLLKGLATSPAVLGVSIPLAGPAASHGASVDPFTGYHREVLDLFDTMARVESDEASDPLMDRWGEIDRSILSGKPTTIEGAVGCLEYARREYVQFKMHDNEDTDDPGDRLMLHLIDCAIGVMRASMGRPL